MTARVICITPCDPPAEGSLSIEVPLGGFLESGASLSLEGDCTDCEAVGNLLLQLQPLFGALGLPLCLLGCLAAVVGVAQALGDVMTSLPAPDPSEILVAIENVVTECACVLQLADPTGVCAFIRMIRDFLRLAIGICNCAISLFGHLVTLSIKADAKISGLNSLGRPYDKSVVETAECMNEYVTVTQKNLLVRFEVLSVVFALIEPVFTFVESLFGPLPIGFQDIKDAFDAFAAFVANPGVIPSEVISALTSLKNLLQGAYDLLAIPGCTT